jgi:anti-anti-sigma factor
MTRCARRTSLPPHRPTCPSCARLLLVAHPRPVDLMTQVSIDIREAGERHVVVAIAGEIDLATAPLLAGALRWYRECDVIVDLSAVRLLDASGLTVLIRTQKRLRRTGHTLRTTGESGGVLAAMRLAGLVDTVHGCIAEDPAAP